MQQIVNYAKEPIRASVSLPGAKNITQRALLLAALADGVSELNSLHLSEDIKTFITALYQLGIVAQCDESTHSCIIAGGNGKFPKKQASIWCGDNETAARFLLAACSVTPGVYYFDGTPTLRAKPIAQLFNVLRMQGVQFIPSDVRKLPCTLIAADEMQGGDIIFDGVVINQIVSALLLIAPFAKTPFNFALPEDTLHPSIDLTSMMMAEFGVLVHRIHNGQYTVPVPQKYIARDYTIEPDFSLATYFCAAAAVTQGEVTLVNIKRAQSKQSTNKFFNLLEKMHCRVFETAEGVTIMGPKKLQGIQISLREFSDTFLTIAALAPFAETPTRITHTGSLKQRELNRLIEMKSELIKLGVHVDSGRNWIEIQPGQPQPGTVYIRTDYRLAMAFAIIGLKTPGLVIENVETINSSFPQFFSLWNSLTTQETVQG